MIMIVCNDIFFFSIWIYAGWPQFVWTFNNLLALCSYIDNFCFGIIQSTLRSQPVSFQTNASLEAKDSTMTLCKKKTSLKFSISFRAKFSTSQSFLAIFFIVTLISSRLNRITIWDLFKKVTTIIGREFHSKWIRYSLRFKSIESQIDNWSQKISSSQILNEMNLIRKSEREIRIDLKKKIQKKKKKWNPTPRWLANRSHHSQSVGAGLISRSRINHWT